MSVDFPLYPLNEFLELIFRFRGRRELLPSLCVAVLEEQRAVRSVLNHAFCAGDFRHGDVRFRQIAFVDAACAAFKADEAHTEVFANCAAFPPVGGAGGLADNP